MLLAIRAATTTARAAGTTVTTTATRTAKPTSIIAAAGLGRRRLRTRRGRTVPVSPATAPSLASRQLSEAMPAIDEDAAPLAVGAGGGRGDRAWTWATPSPMRRGRGFSPHLPIKPRVNLTVEEVVAAVEAQGAMDVQVVDVRGKGSGMGDYFIFCSCTTPLHMRRLADMIVHALKKRKLVKAVGITGAEGYDCDDWMLVDCDNLMVNFMMPETRAYLDLEKYWRNARPEDDSALAKKRARGEEGHVEDDVEWEEDFGEEHDRHAHPGVMFQGRNETEGLLVAGGTQDSVSGNVTWRDELGEKHTTDARRI